MNEGPKATMKILVIRRDNIGDLICTTPLFEAIRQQYPQAYIAALVNSYNAPAIEGNPHLDAIFAYTKGKHAAGESVWQAYFRRAKLLWQLRRMKFDYVVLATSGFAVRALKLARMLAPKHIVGFVTEQASSDSIDQAIAHADGAQLHETQDMFRLLAPVGISGEIPGVDRGARSPARQPSARAVAGGGAPGEWAAACPAYQRTQGKTALAGRTFCRVGASAACPACSTVSGFLVAG